MPRSATDIVSIAIKPLELPLAEPFEIAGGRETTARNILACVRLRSGAVGWGEGAPMPSYNDETQSQALRAAHAIEKALLGQDASSWRKLLERIEELIPDSGAARSACGMAVLDAWTRHAHVPLRTLFGGAERAIASDITIPLVSPEAAGQAARRILALGVRTIKIKVGRDVAEDEARVRAVAATNRRLRLMLDANQGYRPEESLKLLRLLKRQDIVPVLFEQPAPAEDYEGLRRVMRLGKVPVAADESASSRQAVWRLVRQRAADVINIKLTKCGLLEAWDIASIARAAGLKLMIGGNIESSLSMTAAAHFAAGLGGFSFVDLDTPLWLARNPMKGVFMGPGGVYDLAEVKAGIGVVPR